ncbi:MAG: bifunctional biotin--[acetyl-CoA-carboxylase] ligase/biotin operon repressor BirA [Spongiibacteraceae bacterium]
MVIQTLLATLADGQFHSGDGLGASLGVSRTAIWKQLKKVEELGVQLESIKGKGYRIPQGLNLLSRQLIESELTVGAAALISEIDVQDAITSTNRVAMEKALQGGAKGYVCTAEQQSAGRGRRGRAWVSPYAGNIYLSVVWEFSGGASALEGLSLAVGVAVADALAKAGVGGVGLKWPNDILYEDKKLAGILIEMTGDADGLCQVVIGVGLNVAMPAKVAADIDQAWVDVASINPRAAERNRLLGLVLNELMPLLEVFARSGFSVYRDRWAELDAYLGKTISIIQGNDITVGCALGIDDTGAIKIETEQGVRVFNGGEVSLRLAGSL